MQKNNTPAEQMRYEKQKLEKREKRAELPMAQLVSKTIEEIDEGRQETL